jgi:hypothetical protein
MAWRLRFYRGCLSNFRPGGGLGTAILRPGGRKQSSRLVPDNNDTKIKQWTKKLGLKWPGGFVWAAVRTSPFYHVVAMVKVCPVWGGWKVYFRLNFNIMLNLANCIGASVYLWLVDEKKHFLQTNLHKTPSEKNVSNCSSVNLNVSYLLRVQWALQKRNISYKMDFLHRQYHTGSLNFLIGTLFAHGTVFAIARTTW